MGGVRLGAVTLFARDVDALAGFYQAALGLEAAVDDSPRYRELAGGGVRLGFAFQGAYDLLALDDARDPTGLRSVLTFDLAADLLDAAVARATNAGAVVAKPAYATHFGARMAVLRDPEGNAFRLNAVAAA
ncbi:VOC family protein [Sphingomonas sp. CJ20]